MKILRSLTWSIPVVSICGLLAAFVLVPQEMLPDFLISTRHRVNSLFTEGDPDVSEDDANSEQWQQQIREGNALLRQARLLLQHNTQTISADLLQIIQTPNGDYRATGSYIQAPASRTFLSVDMQVGDTKGQIRQISNGQVSWFLQQIIPEKSETDEQPARQRVERVDLQRVSDYLQTHQKSRSDSEIAREVHCGLTGLLATLESSMDFRISKQVTINGQPCFVLEGTWKALEEQQPQEKEAYASQVFFNTRPDLVRLFIQEVDLMPVRYLCLKKHPGKPKYYAQLAMELTNLKHHQQFNPQLFNWQPTNEQVAKDITHEYLARLERAGEIHENRTK